MTQNQPPTTIFCPTCGAQNPADAPRCSVCGQPLTRPNGPGQTRGSADRGEVIDLFPIADVSSQTTTPFTQTRPFDPADYRTPPSPAAPPPRRSTVGAWSSTPGAPPPAGTPVAAPPVRVRKGPHGCVLGCFALILIGIVAALVVWGAIRPSVSNRVEDDLSVGITNELRTVPTVPAPASGQIVLTETQINDDLARAADRYDPITDVKVRVRPDGVEASFKVYGLSATYRGGLAVVNGRIVVVDPELSGVAGYAIDVDKITGVFEQEVNDLLNRSNLHPTDVRLRDGSIVIVTAVAGATPVARPSVVVKSAPTAKPTPSPLPTVG